MEMWTTNNSSTNSLLSVNGNLSNFSSHNQLCTGFYHPVMAVFDILTIVFNLPITLYVIVELLGQCGTSLNPGTPSPFSLSVIFFLHLCCVHFFFYVGVLLIIIRNLGGVTGIKQEYIMALRSSSLIGGSFFFAVMTIDLYMAVAHPIMYVGLKTSTKQTVAHTCCTFIWVYSATMGIVTVIFDISMYHPLLMTSFYVPLPVIVFCGILALVALRTARPGKSSKPDKTKQSAIWFILNSTIILIFYYIPNGYLLIYTAVKKIELESLPCDILMVIQVAEFLAPLVFFYNTGKLKAMATHCSIVFRNSIGLC